MNDAEEREWQAQEHARQAERFGLDPSSDDSRVRRYRLIARTLRQPLPNSLPSDFAAQVAARSTALPASARLESVLLALLAGLLVVVAGVVLAGDGRNWLPAAGRTLPTADPQDLHWLLAFVGCIGLSWLLWQRPQRSKRLPFA